MEATRQILWNIEGQGFIEAWSAIVSASLLAGFLLRLACWSRGMMSCHAHQGRKTLFATIHTIVTFKGIHLGHFPLLMHRCIFYGFMFLVAGTSLVAFDLHFNAHFLHGAVYLCFSVILDIAGVVFFIGILLAAYKRYIVRAERLENNVVDAVILALLGLIVVSGFFVEGLRIGATLDPWKIWSPIGCLVAKGGMALLTPLEAKALHATAWHLHASLSFLFLALAPWTKLTHILALPLNLHFVRPAAGRNRLRAVSERCLAGTATLADLPIDARIETDACMQCGRCRKQCPISIGGRLFSPETLFKGQRRALHTGAWQKNLIGSVVDADALWSCTACRSCEERCPMGGEHVERIADMRRSAVAAGTVPKTLAERFRKHEEMLQNTHGVLPVNFDPVIVYIWPGCHAAEEGRRGVVLALLVLMKRAGVTAVVLDPPACCSGTDRILGNERLFQKAAKANIEYLQSIKGATIVTPCPHCYNTLKNEYQSLEESFTLLHHSSFLEQLSKKGLLPSIIHPPQTVTYHDPCFLGRYNSGYEPSRNLLGGIPGISLVEMKQSRKKSFCCGSGGGGVTTDSAKANARRRVRQAISTGADLVVTGCPYCRDILFEAATDQHGQQIMIADIAELFIEVDRA